MAKRELSSSLRNLKFMQRAIQREEMMKKQEEDDVKPDGGLGGLTLTSAAATQLRKCVVVMEGDPKPGAIKGRMSFKGFNPLIEKLNEASANPNGDHKRKHFELMSATQNPNKLCKTNYSSPYKAFNKLNQASANPNGNHKVVSNTQYPNKWHKTNQGYRQPSLTKSRDSFKKPEGRNCWTTPLLGVKEFNQKRLIITR